MTVKGEVKDEPLSLATQDLASYAYQFMFLPKLLKNKLLLTMSTGKRLNQYTYQISYTQELLTIAGAPCKTLHLAQIEQSTQKTDTKELWLSVEQYYLPVRLLMVDDHGQKLEQTLTELHVE